LPRPRRARPKPRLPASRGEEPGEISDVADQQTQATSRARKYWLILSVAAVLPILWAFTLALHFARPYVIRYLQTLTLRFGGDVWWLSYV